MKRCKDCKWFSVYRRLSLFMCPFWRDEGCKVYCRKWWKFWIPKILLTLALLLSGCVHVTLPDGTKYWRLGEQQIGEVLFTMPDGTEFLMVRQKSAIPVWIVTPAGWQLGEARKVKP